MFRSCLSSGLAAAICASAAGVASAELLAYDDFDTAPGSLNAVNTGSGWSGGWQVQNSDVSIPGYEVRNSNPLTYPGLQSDAGYAVGGDSFQDANRPLDVDQDSDGSPDSLLFNRGYLVNAGDFNGSNNQVGADGKTLYWSLLFRVENDNNAEAFAYLTRGNFPGSTVGSVTDTGLAVGYFGTASQSNGDKFWSVRTSDGSGFSVTQTSAELTPGEVALLVVKLEFDGANDTASVFINPTTAVEGAPLATFSGNFDFRRLGFFPTNGFNGASMDEVRFGETFADVLPGLPIPEPASLTLLALGAGLVARRGRSA